MLFRSVWGVSFSPDGQTIASASLDKTIKTWNLNGTIIRTFEGHTNWVGSVCFSPDGQIIASSSYDKTIRLWKLDGTHIQTFQGHTDKIRRVCFSPNGKMLLSASLDKTARLWQIDNRETTLDLDKLMKLSYTWLHDYLKTNPNISTDDSYLCSDAQHLDHSDLIR